MREKVQIVLSPWLMKPLDYCERRACERDQAEASRAMSQMDPIQTFKVGCVIRGKELEEKRPLDVLCYSSSVPLPPSLSPCLPDKVLSSGVGRSRKPSGRTTHKDAHSHSGTSLCLLLLVSHTHTHIQTNTLTHAHTACEVDARLGPWPWLVLGLLEKDRSRNGERSWEQWWCWSLGSEACRLCWATFAILCIDFCCSALLHSAAEAPSRRG